MAQLDEYLVEKLREILERLYSKNKLASGGTRGSGTSDSGGLSQKQSQFESVSQQQQLFLEQPGSYSKRSPFLFPDAPLSEQDMNSQLGNLSEKIELGSGTESDYFESETKRNESYYGTRQFRLNNESIFSESRLEPVTYGVEVNYTSIENNSLVGESDLGESEDDSSALTRNLHEFIHILKMSLKSGSSGFPSEDHSVFHPSHDGKAPHNLDDDGNSWNSISATRSTNPFSGIESASTTNMEFNLTLDDILDLNNLLDGDDATFGLPLKHILIIFTYLAIACVSIIGNLLVVQLVIRSRRFHTLTHALLANLAAADLFLATFNIPFSAARVIMTEWPFGSFLCRTVPFVQVTSVYATSFTMAVIALDRYKVIMNPLGKRLKCSQGVLLVIAIWTVSAILSLPYALNHRVVTLLTVRIVKRCQAEFGSLQARQWLTVATFLAQYLLPLLFTTASYIAIMKRLWHRSSGLGSTTPRQVAAQSRAKRKTIKMLVLTVICFAISWAPINIYHLLTHFSHVRHNSTALLICHMIAMSSSMYNPFIFCGLNEHFRREAVKWLHCFRTRRSPIVHPGAEVNGMLARTDQASRRNLSTTVVHTTVSCRRSPQHNLAISPRSCQRRRIMAPTHSPSATYLTSRSNAGERVELSPGIDRAPTDGNSPTRYKPEMLFLVKGIMSQSDPTVDPEDMDSGEDIMNGDDFLDSLCDEWNLCGDYKNCKRNNQSDGDKNDRVSLSRDSTHGDEDLEENDEAKAETAFMGEVETTTLASSMKNAGI